MKQNRQIVHGNEGFRLVRRKVLKPRPIAARLDNYVADVQTVFSPSNTKYPLIPLPNEARCFCPQHLLYQQVFKEIYG
jgi:hypothetical protein